MEQKKSKIPFLAAIHMNCQPHLADSIASMLGHHPLQYIIDHHALHHISSCTTSQIIMHYVYITDHHALHHRSSYSTSQIIMHCITDHLDASVQSPKSKPFPKFSSACSPVQVYK